VSDTIQAHETQETHGLLDWCRALGCETRVRKPHVMCERCWREIPPEIRSTVALAWRTKWWEEAVDKAVSHLATKRGFRRAAR